MRRLNNSVAVNAPSRFALAYVSTYLLERGPQGSAKLALRFPLPNILIHGLTIEKTVVLRLAYTTHGASAKDVAISWDPLATRALPSFAGTLSAPERGETCRLLVEGEYTAPGGVFGAIFDSLVGVYIARATLLALLTQFGHAIEADYAMRVSP